MGTYCPPLAVFLDTGFLRTLPQRHLSNGAAEIMKMACIKDAQLFALLEQHSADLLATNFQVRNLAFIPLLQCNFAVLHPSSNYASISQRLTYPTLCLQSAIASMVMRRSIQGMLEVRLQTRCQIWILSHGALLLFSFICGCTEPVLLCIGT